MPITVPKRIAVLNLMPKKQLAESCIIQILSSSSFSVEIDFIALDTHKPKTTSQQHMKEFYTPFSQISHIDYDGFIITGAPVERLEFAEVTYWDEMTGILNLLKQYKIPTLFICWAAQAALFNYYGIKKYPLDKKLVGVYEHKCVEPENPLFKHFAATFYAPHSRYTEIRKEDIEKVPELALLSESKDAGVYLVQSCDGKETYITGHPEYTLKTLHQEYERDMAKFSKAELPYNYYPDDDPTKEPVDKWKLHAAILFENWLKYSAVSAQQVIHNL
ncbi:MAG: homoserine O-succinyltransferase [Prevotellaceae bacterium]|jgi:homoserine O-succinyltransferase|nr:homoserine O-succinyltransferase [Prevotellaceae bacterium]